MVFVTMFFVYKKSLETLWSLLGDYLMPAYEYLNVTCGIPKTDMVGFVILSFMFIRAGFEMAKLIREIYRASTFVESAWRRYYLWSYAVKPTTYFAPKTVAYNFVKVNGSLDVVKEGAFSKGTLISAEEPEPSGVFTVYMKNEDGVSFMLIGHGFVVAGCLYTPYHVAALSDSLFVGSPGKPSCLIPVEVDEDTVDPNMDFCQLKGKAVAAALGIKSLKLGVYRKKAVVVYHRDSTRNSVYIAQHINPHAYSFYPMPHVIATDTITDHTDSGLPVMQDGHVVAMHIGASLSKQVNVHHLLLQLSKTVVDRKVKVLQAIVSSGVTVESPSVGEEDDNERWRAIAQARQDEEEERKLERMRGEHQDDQGYRVSSKYIPPKFKGPSWADEVEYEAGDGDEGNEQAPAVRALQVPPQTAHQTPTERQRQLQALQEMTKAQLSEMHAKYEKLSALLETLLQDGSGESQQLNVDPTLQTSKSELSQEAEKASQPMSILESQPSQKAASKKAKKKSSNSSKSTSQTLSQDSQSSTPPQGESK